MLSSGGSDDGGIEGPEKTLAFDAKTGIAFHCEPQQWQLEEGFHLQRAKHQADSSITTLVQVQKGSFSSVFSKASGSLELKDALICSTDTAALIVLVYKQSNFYWL